MSNPQIENGYIKIALELMDALISYRIPGEQRQCLDFILRKTYGWGKKEDIISLSQFVLATGIKKPAVVRALKGLEEKKIIVIKNDNKVALIYSINKNYKTWKPLSKKITTKKNIIKKDNDKDISNGNNLNNTNSVIKKDNNKPLSKKITSVIKKDNASLSKKSTTINTTTKDTITIDRILSLYHEHLPELPKIRSVKTINKSFQQRLKENKDFQSVEWWKNFFLNDIKTSDFLMGRKKDFRATLNWILLPTNFEKILNGSYVNIDNKHHPTPQTYAQCQDAESRQQTEMLKQLREKRLKGGHNESDQQRAIA